MCVHEHDGPFSELRHKSSCATHSTLPASCLSMMTSRKLASRLEVQHHISVRGIVSQDSKAGSYMYTCLFR